MKIKRTLLDQKVEKVVLVKDQETQTTTIDICFKKEVTNIVEKDQDLEREAMVTQEETVRRDTVFLKVFTLDRAVNNNFKNAI